MNHLKGSLFRRVSRMVTCRRGLGYSFQLRNFSTGNEETGKSSPRVFDGERHGAPRQKQNPSIVGPTIAEGDIIDDSADSLFTNHQYALDVEDQPMVTKQHIYPALRFSPDGTIDHCQFDLNGLHSVPARDLQLLEPELDGEMRMHAPVILPRRDCIIISISHIKCVVFHDTMIMLDINNPLMTKFATLLGNYLRQTIPDPQDIDPIDETFRDSFEMRVLEGILRVILDTYSRRLRCYNPVIEKVLEEMSTGQVEIKNIQRLQPVRDSLISFERAANELVNCLKSQIRSEDDRKGLFLTARRQVIVQTMRSQMGVGSESLEEHDMLAKKNLPLSIFRFHVKDAVPIPYHALRDVELLLESFERESMALRDECMHLQQKIRTSEDFLRIVRDVRRNMLITLQAKTALGSFSVAAGALMTGVFGMNLFNGMETHPNAFIFFACVSSMIPMLLYRRFSTNIMDTVSWTLIQKFKRKMNNSELQYACRNSKTIDNDDDKLLLLKHVRASISVLGDIQDDVLESIDGRDWLNREDLRRLLETSTKRKVEDSLLDIILSFYGDGQVISTNQLRVMQCDSPSSNWTKVKNY